MEGIERIKILASEIKDKPLLKIVEYLLSREDMNDKYLNEEKSLKQMITFIKDEARKQASKDNVAILEDQEVYSLAIHYWDESNERLELKSEKDIGNEIDKKENVIPEKKKQVVPEGQLTLFDI